MNVSVSSFISIVKLVKGILLEKHKRSALATRNVGTQSLHVKSPVKMKKKLNWSFFLDVSIIIDVHK